MCAERAERRAQSAERGVRRAPCRAPAAESAVRSAHREEHRAESTELLSVCGNVRRGGNVRRDMSAVCVVARVRARWRAHPFRFNESVLPLADCASCWQSCFCELLSSADELCRAPVRGQVG